MTNKYEIYCVKVSIDETESFEDALDCLSAVIEYGTGRTDKNMPNKYKIYCVKVSIDETESFEDALDCLSAVIEYGPGTDKMYNDSLGEILTLYFYF